MERSACKHCYPGDSSAVAKLPFQHEGWDVLIGMDIIASYHITMYNNKFILSN